MNTPSNAVLGPARSRQEGNNVASTDGMESDACGGHAAARSESSFTT